MQIKHDKDKPLQHPECPLSHSVILDQCYIGHNTHYVQSAMMLNRQRKQLFTSAVTVFQGHELGAWFWAQCVKSHKKRLKHLKCFGKLGWILKIKCICQPKQEAACFGQVSKIGKAWYSLNDDSYCIWLTADIDAHVASCRHRCSL